MIELSLFGVSLILGGIVYELARIADCMEKLTEDDDETNH